MSENNETFEISATPKVLERVYYAIAQMKKHEQRTAAEINERIAKKFGKPLSNSHWTVLNRARRAEKLDEIVTANFDFKKHGRTTNTSPKQKREKSKQSVSVESKKHARYLVAVWGAGAATHIPCKTKKAVQSELRTLMGKGIALKDIAVYAVEPFALQVSVRI